MDAVVDIKVHADAQIDNFYQQIDDTKQTDQHLAITTSTIIHHPVKYC